MGGLDFAKSAPLAIAGGIDFEDDIEWLRILVCDVQAAKRKGSEGVPAEFLLPKFFGKRHSAPCMVMRKSSSPLFA